MDTAAILFGMPERHCHNCGKDFGRPPLLIKGDKAEDYRDIVESVEFSCCAYISGETVITIKKNETGASVTMHDYPRGRFIDDKQISSRRWNSLVNKLFSCLYLHEWKKRFRPKDMIILDGEYWMLKVRLTSGRIRTWAGDNEYPPYWTELKALLRSALR